MPYLLDTNTWIDLDWRRIPRASFPSLWAKIEGGVDTGEIFIPDMVYNEILGTTDDEDELAKWIKQKRDDVPGFILDSTEQIQEIAIKLIQKHQLRADADPFLVGCASIHGCTVVSAEKRMRPGEKPRVPNLCDEVEVPCRTLLEMIRENGWVF